MDRVLRRPDGARFLGDLAQLVPAFDQRSRARALARRKLAEVEAQDVRALYADLRAADLSTSGIRGLRAALSAMFATAVEDGLIRSNPVRGVRIQAGRFVAPTDDHAKALTREELSALLAAFPDDWRLFFEFPTHTGLRISEPIGLQWRHVELEGHPRILVREQFYNGERQRLKSGTARRDIPLSPGMSDRLQAHRRERSAATRRRCSPQAPEPS